MQCGKPSCVSVCPVVATDKNEDGGIVSQIYPRCIGCRYCMASCPYHARYFNWYDPICRKAWKRPSPRTFRASPRRGGKMHLLPSPLDEAKDKAIAEGRNPYELADGEYVTSCTEVCPNGAISFGDSKNPEHKVYELIRSPHAFRLLERLGTDPQVYYLSKREWVRRQGDNYLENEKTKG